MRTMLRILVATAILAGVLAPNNGGLLNTLGVARDRASSGRRRC